MECIKRVFNTHNLEFTLSIMQKHTSITSNEIGMKVLISEKTKLNHEAIPKT